MAVTYDHIVIDTNNVFHKNHHVFSDLVYTYKGVTIHTGGIYGSLKSFNSLRSKYLATSGKMWALFDNAKSKANLRKLIDSEYKLNRGRMSKAFYRAIDYFRLILLNHTDGDYTVYGTGYEADDIVPVVLHRIPMSESVLLVSEDLDWSRLIGYEGRHIDQYMKKTIYDKRKFLETYQFEPTANRVILYKTIKGDSVDNIPVGLPRIPTKIVLRLLDDYADVYEIKKNLSLIDYLNDDWKRKFMENFARLKTNHQLVSFLKLQDKDISPYVSECHYRPSQLRVLYEGLGFNVEKIDLRLYKELYNPKETLQFDNFWIAPSIHRK